MEHIYKICSIPPGLHASIASRARFERRQKFVHELRITVLKTFRPASKHPELRGHAGGCINVWYTRCCRSGAITGVKRSIFIFEDSICYIQSRLWRLVSRGATQKLGGIMTAEIKKNQHDASASATGYLYQCRYALLLGLQAIATRPELLLNIEKFDDISFSNGEGPIAQIQTKHHVSKRGNLTDTSEDLWSTLRVWSEQVAADHEKAFKTAFILTTTATAPDGSAASFLRIAGRDLEEARTLLLNVAAKSKSKKNEPAYLAFTTLSESLQRNFLKSVSVLDRSANLTDVRDQLCHAVRLAVSKEHVEHFVERLEGWWFGLMTKVLLSGSNIPVLTIDGKLDELREEFSRNNLPVDFGRALPPMSIIADLDKRPFVAQLKRVNVGARRIEWAIRDYYRASEQRSKWAREKLTLDGEVEQYEQNLIEAWQPRFAEMVDNLPTPCDEKTKAALGQKLYQWAEQDALLPLRSIAQRFLTHGSFHILANRYAVGWHPEFDRPEDSTSGAVS